MPSVMFRENEQGQMTMYIPKKDLEENVENIELQSETEWGGEVTLADGSSWYLKPLEAKPKLPITLRVTRSGD